MQTRGLRKKARSRSDMTEDYLQMLTEATRKKIAVLDKALDLSVRQDKLLDDPVMDMDAFGRISDEKGGLVDELNRLDEGFEDVYYDRVRDQIRDSREKYAGQISELKELIREVTDKTVQLQARELRSKKKAEEYFNRQYKKIGDSRRSSKAAYDYYRSMKNINNLPPQFMDDKN